MANDLRNLTVRLSLDRLNFDSGLSSVNRALNTLRGELNTTASGVGVFQNESERARARMDVLTRSIQAQEEKIRLLRESYQNSATATGEDSRATQMYAAQVNRAVTELGRMQGELTATTEQLHRIESSTTSASERMTTMGNKLQNAGLQIGAVFGSIALVVGGALKDAIKTGAEFEQEIAKVGSKADASQQDLKKLSETAIKLAPLAGGAKNAATAMDDLAAKGYSVNQIITAMPGILSAANASGEDLALTSDTITSALETFKLKTTDTNHVADVLAKTANLTAAGMSDLQYTFKYAAAPASALGISMEQLASMTGIMANQGIKGEQAGTSLREAMLRLVNPPKQAANALHDLHVKVTDSTGKFRNFSDIIGDLNSSTSKMTNAQKTAALAHIFGTNAVSGMLAVVSAGKPKIDKFTESLKNSDGASAKAAKAMQDNLAGSLKKLNGSIDAAKIGIEQALAPALKKIVDIIQSVVDKFNNLSPGMKQFIAISLAVTAVVAGIAATIGAVLAAVGGFMIAIGELGLTIGGIASTIGIVVGAVAGIVALGIGFYELYKHCKPVHDVIDSIGQAIKGAFQKVSEFIQGIAAIAGGDKSNGNIILTYLGFSPGTILEITNTFDSIKKAIQNTIDFVKGIASIIGGDQSKGNIILTYLGFSPATILSITTIINGIKTVISTVLKDIWSVMKTIGDGISKFWDANGKQIMGFVSVAWNGITSTIGTLITTIKNVVFSVLQAMAQFWNDHGRQIMAIVNGAFTIIKAYISGALGYISGIFQVVFPIVSGVVQTAFAIIKTAIKVAGDYISGVVDVVVKLFNGDWKGAFDSAKNTCTKIWNDILNTFKGVDLYQIGVDIVNGLINGIGSMVSSVTSTISNIANSIGDTAKKVLGIKSPSRVMMELGGYVSEGMAIGMDNNAHKVLNASNNLSKNAIPNMNQTQNGLNGMNNGQSGKGGNTYNFYPQKAIIDKNDITREIQRMEALYG